MAETIQLWAVTPEGRNACMTVEIKEEHWEDPEFIAGLETSMSQWGLMPLPHAAAAAPAPASAPAAESAAAPAAEPAQAQPQAGCHVHGMTKARASKFDPSGNTMECGAFATTPQPWSKPDAFNGRNGPMYFCTSRWKR